MNKKTVIRLIIAILIIAAGSYFYAYIKKDAALYDTSYTRSQMVPSIGIYSDRDFVYEFTADGGSLTGMKLMLSYAGKKTGVIEYSLTECGSDVCAASGSLKLSKFKSGKFSFLDIKTIKDSAGKRYRLTVSCANSEEDAALAAVVPDGFETPAVCCTYRVWDLQTMLISAFLAAYLAVFVTVLVKIFKR
ncbi:MAG: hypothetical protein NC223_04185 [Butyrivibrio sp.]|nr:hypothetical protein [Butyrivibrio sp.]